MKSLYESILRPDDDILQEVELKPVLRKYGWHVQDAYWKGKTLRLVFDGRGYMDDINEVAEELHCKNFSVYPWAIITSKKPLEGFTIDAETKLDITAPKIKGCDLTAKTMGITIIQPNDVRKVEVVNCDFHSFSLCLRNTDGMTLVGNNFDEVTTLDLNNVGPKIEKIVMSWNFITNELCNGVWSTYPYPKGEPKMDLDPMKALGLDKHFKNVNRIDIAGGKRSGHPDHLEFVRAGNRMYDRYEDRYTSLGQGIKVKYLESGWQMFIQR